MQVTIFQLDQCINDKSLADACNSRGMCTVYRYPRRLHGQLDEVMLPEIFTRNNPLLTTDRQIVEQNQQCIVVPNPGIIVIRNKKPLPFMTAGRARSIIEGFKTNVPSWLTINWSMIYIEVNDEGEIYVCPLVSADISQGRAFNVSDTDINTTLTKYIAEIGESLKGYVVPVNSTPQIAN
jgi:hypothetical protein